MNFIFIALSLAASGGYVNIIRLLLNYGAEINSRTGSKLGITVSINGIYYLKQYIFIYLSH
jgi:hypothetical protein